MKNSGSAHVGGFSGFVFKNRFTWLALVMVLGIAADQASKIWAQRNLTTSYQVSEGETKYYGNRTVVVVPGAFNLVYKENSAAAFSLTSSFPDWFRKPFLIIISALATIFFIIWYFRLKSPDGLLMSSFSFILAGAMGNFADRIRMGYVIDFLDVYGGILGYPQAHWPTFNIADSLIVIGAIGVVIRTLIPGGEAGAINKK